MPFNDEWLYYERWVCGKLSNFDYSIILLNARSTLRSLAQWLSISQTESFQVSHTFSR